MSRKWERMVRKNTKSVNTYRKKTGKPTIHEAASEDGAVVYRGRSWFFPMLLVMTGVFCFIAFRGQAGSDAMYWVTGASYLLLAVLIFYGRRPYLKIGRQALTSRRFGGDRTMDASQIGSIEVNKDAVVITLKPKNSRWVFTKLYHLFPVAEAGDSLKAFADRHSIAYSEK